MSVVFTPPQLAKRWIVSPDKVRRWIVSGELTAANLGDAIRPRYRITESDAAKFWQGRQTRKQQARRKQMTDKPREYV